MGPNPSVAGLASTAFRTFIGFYSLTTQQRYFETTNSRNELTGVPGTPGGPAAPSIPGKP